MVTLELIAKPQIVLSLLLNFDRKTISHSYEKLLLQKENSVTHLFKDNKLSIKCEKSIECHEPIS